MYFIFVLNVLWALLSPSSHVNGIIMWLCFMQLLIITSLFLCLNYMLYSMHCEFDWLSTVVWSAWKDWLSGEQLLQPLLQWKLQLLVVLVLVEFLSAVLGPLISTVISVSNHIRSKTEEVRHCQSWMLWLDEPGQAKPRLRMNKFHMNQKITR